jgi:hypothetical protein
MRHKRFKSRERDRLVLGDSAEFRRLHRAVVKASGDRERAVRNVCCLYGCDEIRRTVSRDPRGGASSCRIDG